jgi:methyl-accepting chemotaxis protein
MNWFRNLSIGGKLIAAFSILIVLNVFLGLFSLSSLIKLNHASSFIATDSLPSVEAVAKLAAIHSTLPHFRSQPHCCCQRS